MPTYEFICSNGHKVEQERSFDQRNIETFCQQENCSQSLVRVFSKPSIVFKGGGFFSRGG